VPKGYLPELLESDETFAKKIQLFPRGCLGDWHENELAAYVFSHPWLNNEIVPLDFNLRDLPSDPNCLYIHDLAVSSRFRGRGIADRLLKALFALADSMSYRDFTLVAVQDSEPFWRKYGFQARSKLIYGVNTPASKMTLTRAASA
jgi:ribosomal protein S18 acetylase RimI-like enzyme